MARTGFRINQFGLIVNAICESKNSVKRANDRFAQSSSIIFDGEFPVKGTFKHINKESGE
jgi:hypothetical protein